MICSYSHNLNGIKANGLKHAYVSTNPYIANDEAHNTVHGDSNLTYQMSGKRKSGVGGEPHIVVINRHHPSVKGMKTDPEYKEKGQKAYAFKHDGHIHPDAIVDSFHASDKEKLQHYFKHRLA